MTENAAFLFSGQGAQFVGMGRSLLERSGRVREIFARGSELLGLDLAAICLQGPEDLLHSTRVSQPAIFLLSLAVLDELGTRLGSREPFGRGLRAAAAAGLSLGEYSALVFAGSLEFEDAVRVVEARGRFMQEACDEAPGGMTSLLGLEVEKVEKAVEGARGAGRVGIANYNSPDQTVISGDAAAVEAAARLAMDLGCRKAVPLKVAGAYHSPLMASATRRLEPLLAKVSLSSPRCPFFADVSGKRVSDPEEIRRGLIRQVESPVRWEAIIRGIIASGAREGLEIGPGKVIAGLVRNIDRSMKVTSLCESDAVEAFCGAGVGKRN